MRLFFDTKQGRPIKGNFNAVKTPGVDLPFVDEGLVIACE